MNNVISMREAISNSSTSGLSLKEHYWGELQYSSVDSVHIYSHFDSGMEKIKRTITIAGRMPKSIYAGSVVLSRKKIYVEIKTTYDIHSSKNLDPKVYILHNKSQQILEMDPKYHESISQMIQKWIKMIQTGEMEGDITSDTSCL